MKADQPEGAADAAREAPDAPVHVSVAELREAFGDGRFVEAAEGGRWVIRVIRAGLSGNNTFYPDTVLREAVGLFNGARVFVKSDEEHIRGRGKDVRNLIGGLSGARFVDGAKPDTGEIHAELTLIEPDGTVATQMREAHARGLAGLFGFSIDCTGRATRGKPRVAKTIDKVSSVDLIVEPGAGGELIRLVEAQSPDLETHQEDTMRQRMIEAIQKKRPSYDGEGVSDEQLEADYREAIVPAPAKPTDAGADAEARFEQKLRMIEARAEARVAINDAKLPDAAKRRLHTRFVEAKDFTADDVATAIKDEREYLAQFTESGKVSLDGLADVQVEDRSEKIGQMLDAFFDPAHKDHRAVRSFREAYVEITGDKNCTGQIKDCDRTRMAESLGVFREALTTASWADALGDSITRRMQAIYQGETDLQAWRKVCRVTQVRDFRTQERFRIGGYGNLPGVNQGAAYTALTSPGDDKATYAATKRGGLETITLEMIANDDVGSIRQIPIELALAAANTLYEFVFDFYRTNPTIYDGSALYHASHANLFTAALDATAFAAHRLAMSKQARAGSGKRLGLQPKTLLVPFELQEAAYNLFVRNQNLDKTFVQTINPEVIVPAYWTDTNDWCTVADPMRQAVVEVGFLNGQEEPELFVQDSPTVGSLFSNDQVTYKIRHIYGGGVLVDGFMATTKAVVP